MTLEELTVVINAQTSGLKKELNGVNKQLTDVATTTQKSMGIMEKGFSKLAKSLSVTAIVAGITKIGSAMIETASDLEEVQNVVDVAFGSMADDINEFAENALYAYGLSELSAKQYASTFMAMSNGMGIAADSGKTMSVELTKLAADMASFYNVSQDTANTALKSVFTGETESLKKFGVVMSEANLNAYALSQGITKSYSAMSQAEKVVLRYNFVLNSTKNAQGDYARTSDSWANQLKLLSNQWTQLKGIVGSFLVEKLTPVLIKMNEILATIIAIAKALFTKSENKTVIDEAEKTSETLGETIDSNINKVKELKKSLAGFDELTILNNNDESTDTGEVKIDTSISEGLNSINESLNKLNVNIDLDKIEKSLKTIKIILIAIGALALIKSLLSGSLFSGLATVIGAISTGMDAMSGNALHFANLWGKGSWFADTNQPLLKSLNDLKASSDNFGTSWTALVTKIKGSAIVKWVSGIGAIIAGLTIAVNSFFDMWEDKWSIGKGLLTALGVAIAAVGAIILGAPAAITAVIAAIVAVVANLVIIIKDNWSSITAWTTKTWNAMVTGLKSAWTGFTGWLGTTFNNIKTGFLNVWNGITGGIKTAINFIIEGVNSAIAGLNKIHLPNWSILGEAAGKGFNIPKIAYLANGGVISGPTIAMLGEYAGAKSNPEIAAPKSILEGILNNSNGEMVGALVQIGQQIITAINNNQLEVKIGDDVIARSAARGNNNYRLQTGRALI